VRTPPVGDHNNWLNRAVLCLGMLATGGELDHDLVEDELLAAAADVCLGETEAVASIPLGSQRRRPGLRISGAGWSVGVCDTAAIRGLIDLQVPDREKIRTSTELMSNVIEKPIAPP
jgi:hypothetical protein